MISFLFGAALGFFTASLVVDTPEGEFPLEATISAAVVGSMMAGLVLCLLQVAFVLVGVILGLVIGLAANALFLSATLVANGVNPALGYAAIGLLAILFGGIALKAQKVVILIGSPFLGAFMVVSALDMWIEDHDFNPVTLATNEEGCLEDSMCYSVYSAMLAVGLIGLWVQWRYTSSYAEERRAKRELREVRRQRRAQHKSMLRQQREDLDLFRELDVYRRKSARHRRRPRDASYSRRFQVPDPFYSFRDYYRNPLRTAPEQERRRCALIIYSSRFTHQQES